MRLSRHIRTKGYTDEELLAVLEHPTRITNVSRYPNQRRFIGNGIAIVADIEADVAITVYLDGVITPLREDQRNDPRALASRRLNGYTDRNSTTN